MADQKVTKMVMKVDLQCDKCYRKIKKVLCSCPKIRDQVFDEKQNTVTITVVCCSPEKIMEKITRKAGDTVESIEILPDKPKEPEKKEPEKAKEPEKPKPVEKAKEPEKPKPVEKAKEPEKQKPAEKAKEQQKPVEKPKEPEKQKPTEPEKPKEPLKTEKSKVVFVEPPKEAAKPPARVPAPAPATSPAPQAPAPSPSPALPPTLPEPIVQGFPQLTPAGPVPMYPVAMCCCCHEGGPCYHGYGLPPTSYNGYVQPAYELPNSNRGYDVNRCDYFSDENASGCSIM